MNRLISLITALVIAISSMSFTVFADDGGKENGGGGSGGSRSTYSNILRAYTNAVAEYANGNITYEEFVSRSSEISGDLAALGTSDALGILSSDFTERLAEQVGKAVAEYGLRAPEIISEWISDFFDSYKVLSETPSFDMDGAGAVLVTYTSDEYVHYYYSSSYGNVRINTEPYNYVLNSPVFRMIHYKNGKVTNDSGYGSWAGVTAIIGRSNVTSVQIYGDWRYIPESEDLPPTDDEYIQSESFDFSNATDKELEDLLNQILEQLELQQPDLSSIEGLLKAIYNRLGTLDSDNDNALLSSLNSSILALMQSNNQNNEELVKSLLEFREALQNGSLNSPDGSDDSSGSSSSGHGHEIYGTLYNVKPLDKNWLNKLMHDKENLKVDYEGKTYYLEDCGCLKLGENYYRCDMNYESYTTIDFDFSNENIDVDRSKYVDVDFSNYNLMWNNLSISQKNKINSVVDSIYNMVKQAVPYTAITSSFAPFELIIFNTATPRDIVFEFQGNDYVGGFNATILSYSFFNNSYVSTAMGIVKPFITVIIGYAWLKVMRKKAVSMLG